MKKYILRIVILLGVSFACCAEKVNLVSHEIHYRIGLTEKKYIGVSVDRRVIENNFTDCLIGNIMTELLQYNDIHLDEKNRDLYDRLLKLAGQSNLPLDDIIAAQLKRAAPHVPNEWADCLRSAEQIITKRLNTPPNDLELPGTREFETFMGETTKDLK